MFKPETIHVETLENNSFEIAKLVMSMQNENPFPETGTLGYTFGCALALGNIASLYCTGMTRRERKDFEEILLASVKESFRHPFVQGSIFEAETTCQ